MVWQFAWVDSQASRGFTLCVSDSTKIFDLHGSAADFEDVVRYVVGQVLEGRIPGYPLTRVYDN